VGPDRDRAAAGREPLCTEEGDDVKDVTYTNSMTTMQVPTIEQLQAWSAQFDEQRRQNDAELIAGLRAIVTRSGLLSTAAALGIEADVLYDLVNGRTTEVPGWVWDRCEQASRAAGWTPKK
jgi:hypothetical protein